MRLKSKSDTRLSLRICCITSFVPKWVGILTPPFEDAERYTYISGGAVRSEDPNMNPRECEPLMHGISANCRSAKRLKDDLSRLFALLGF